MILFIGQVASDQRDREAFQEVDYRQMFGPGTLGFAKWVGEVHDADRLPEYVARAFHTAMQGRPGPVVLALPEDMLTRADRGAGAAARRAGARRAGARGAGARCASCSPRRERPFVIVGGSGWTRGACAGAASASPSTGSCRSAAPSASRTCSTTAIRTTPATSASASIRSSRRASARPTWSLAIGPRLGEMTTGGYTLLQAAAADAEAGAHPRRRRGARPRLRRRPAAAVVDGLRRAGARRRSTPPAVAAAGPTWTAAAHADYEANLRADAGRAARHGRGRRRRSQRLVPDRHASSPTAPATSAAGCIASTATRACATPAARSSRRPRARWATACRPRSPRRCWSRDRTVDQPRRRRRLPDDRPGAGDGDRARRGTARGKLDQRSSSTTAPTARSACTRSASTRAASAAAISATPTSRRWRAPTAGGRRARRDDRRVRAGACAPRSARGRPTLIHLRLDADVITSRTTLARDPRRSAERRASRKT